MDIFNFQIFISVYIYLIDTYWGCWNSLSGVKYISKLKRKELILKCCYSSVCLLLSIYFLLFFSAITKSHLWILPTHGNCEMLKDEQLLLLQIQIWQQWHSYRDVCSFWVSIGKWKNTEDVAFWGTRMVYVKYHSTQAISGCTSKHFTMRSLQDRSSPWLAEKNAWLFSACQLTCH